jgi:DNA polymerase III delta prime subunit
MSELILSEKYRPKTINECILPQEVKDRLNGIIASGKMQSMLFSGSAGVGKTTVARAIANELNADLLFINASMENGIDTMRTKVTQFASTVSFNDSNKITILDECDSLSLDAQKSLRGLIEEFGGNHSIIFTCNYPQKVIDAIHSRCTCIDFKITAKDKPLIAARFLKRVINILDTESIEYEKEAVAALVMKKFPDFRSVLNELQSYSAGGKIDSGILTNLTEESFVRLITALKGKKFGEVRRWVSEHIDIDSAILFRLFYDNAFERLESKSVPELILYLGEFSYKDSFCADSEINRMAFLTTLMVSSNIIWK